MDRVQSIVGLKIVITNTDNKILILKRSLASLRGGTWDLPGGGILLNEAPIAGLEREILEETGLQNIAEILPVYTSAYINSDGQHVFIVGYAGMLQDEQIVILSHEHDEYLWIDPKDIDTYDLPDHRVMTVKKSLEK